MTENTRRPEPPDLGRFHENRVNYPPEQLLPYAGLHVAWSLDGTRILASGEDQEALFAKLDAAGIDCAGVVIDYIDPPGAVYL
jgi:hypothetical protein